MFYPMPVTCSAHLILLDLIRKKTSYYAVLPSSYYFLRLAFKYSPQNSVLEHLTVAGQILNYRLSNKFGFFSYRCNITLHDGEI